MITVTIYCTRWFPLHFYLRLLSYHVVAHFEFCATFIVLIANCYCLIRCKGRHRVVDMEIQSQEIFLVFYTGYCIPMSLHMLLNVSPSQRSIHINSSKYKGS